MHVLLYTVSKFQTYIPRHETARPRFKCLHSCIYERFIYPPIAPPILLYWVCGSIVGIYKSLTDTWMWKLGTRPRCFWEYLFSIFGTVYTEDKYSLSSLGGGGGRHCQQILFCWSIVFICSRTVSINNRKHFINGVMHIIALLTSDGWMSCRCIARPLVCKESFDSSLKGTGSQDRSHIFLGLDKSLYWFFERWRWASDELSSFPF